MMTALICTRINFSLDLTMMESAKAGRVIRRTIGETTQHKIDSTEERTK